MEKVNRVESCFAIDKFHKMKSKEDEAVKKFIIDDLSKRVAEHLADILSSEAQPEPRWIPVTERLPEVNGRYLVTRGLNACGAMWYRVYIVNYSDLMGLKSERIWWDGNVGKSDFKRIDDVIAWMPLEEPWKGGRG